MSTLPQLILLLAALVVPVRLGSQCVRFQYTKPILASRFSFTIISFAPDLLEVYIQDLTTPSVPDSSESPSKNETDSSDREFFENPESPVPGSDSDDDTSRGTVDLDSEEDFSNNVAEQR